MPEGSAIQVAVRPAAVTSSSVSVANASPHLPKMNDETPFEFSHAQEHSL